MTDRNAPLSSDRPVTSPDQDQLGYDAFAGALASSIVRMAPSDGIVAAVYGPWGSGKSTLLNLVVHHLQALPLQDRPVIVSFNPWWFSGHEDLTQLFLKQLAAAVGKHEKLKKLRNKLANFADMVAQVPLPVVTAGAKFVHRMLMVPDQDVPAFKADLAGELARAGIRILILIDDIDRLTAEEIRQVFRTVKAVADFPNVIYLLAFDREVAIRAVEQFQPGISGGGYLEKIVQVPFELPLPEKPSLRRMLFGRLEGILGEETIPPFSQQHWANVFMDGIDHFIRTPRDVVRLTNTLQITYGPVRGEVNPVDFIAIETLRVFAPVAYEAIRSRPDAFAGSTSPDTDRRSTAELLAFHDGWLTTVDQQDREPIRRLLLRLFPKLASIWSNTFFGSSHEPGWRQHLHVCSLEILPIYFRLAVPSGGVSSDELRRVLATAEDPERFGQTLLRLAEEHLPDGTTRLSRVLSRLQDFTETGISQAAVPGVLQVLFDIGDELVRPEDEEPGLIRIGTEYRLGWIFRQLLQRIPEPERIGTLRAAFSSGRAIGTIVRAITLLGARIRNQDSSALPDDQQLLTVEDIRELELLGAQRIAGYAAEGTLLNSRCLLPILHRWREWGGNAAEAWIRTVTTTDTGLACLLEALLATTRSQVIGDWGVREQIRLDPEALRPFLNPELLLERVQALESDTTLPERQRMAARQFLVEYELRRAGKDPNLFHL